MKRENKKAKSAKSAAQLAQRFIAFYKANCYCDFCDYADYIPNYKAEIKRMIATKDNSQLLEVLAQFDMPAAHDLQVAILTF